MKCAKCQHIAVGLVRYPNGALAPLCFEHGRDLTNESKRPGEELPFRAEPVTSAAQGLWQ